jgi:hypothetical protein
LVVLDMLDDVESTNQVKAAVWVWQSGNLTEHRETTASLQAGEGRLADVDERRSGNGESRAQARTDLESRRC